MKAYSRRMKEWSLIATLLLVFSTAASANPTSPTVCIAPPKAQLGQGNDTAVDVSEPVRTTLGLYMAGPSIQLVRLDARIQIQIVAEAVEKRCNFILQTSVVQKKKPGNLFKKLAPLASALPMLGMGGNMNAMMATQVASSAITAGAQQDYVAAMSNAQQSSVKAGDTVTVEYTLARVGATEPPKPVELQVKAKQDGEDVLGPMLEQVATTVLTVALAK